MRRVLIDHQRRVCFFWSPKCASRSLTEWIYSELMGGEVSKEPEIKDGINVRKPPRPRKSSEKRSSSIGKMVSTVYSYDFLSAVTLVQQQGYLAVAFVRHPARRIVSAFMNKLVTHRTSEGIGFEGLEFFAQDAVRAVYETSGRTVDDDFVGISLMELLDYVDGRAKLVRDADTLNAHWNFQAHDEVMSTNLRFDHICTVENLVEDFVPIQNLYGSKRPIGARNTSREYKGTPVDSDADLSTVPSMELLEKAYGSANLLKPQVLERIAGIYKPDYDFLGYDPRDLDAPPTIKESNKTSYRQRTLASILRGQSGYLSWPAAIKLRLRSFRRNFGL